MEYGFFGGGIVGNRGWLCCTGGKIAGVRGSRGGEGGEAECGMGFNDAGERLWRQGKPEVVQWGRATFRS